VDEQRFADLLSRGVVSQAEYDAMKSALGQAQGAHDANLAALRLLESGQRKEDIAIAQARLDSARAGLAAAGTLVSRCTVRAPASGVVFTRYIQPGAWVSPTDGASIPARFSASASPARCRPGRHQPARLGRISAGQRVEMSTDSQPARKIPGVVLRMSPLANLQKNTVQVKIRIEDPPPDLRPDMSVQVGFLEDEGADAAGLPDGVAVPKEAVVQLDGKPWVFLLQGDKAAKRGDRSGGATCKAACW
jgi:multidrug efflux pump subunit AcrA (membrane-fusion protein)